MPATEILSPFFDVLQPHQKNNFSFSSPSFLRFSHLLIILFFVASFSNTITYFFPAPKPTTSQILGTTDTDTSSTSQISITCPGDTNGDQLVNKSDYDLLLANFYQSSPQPPGVDLNSDSRVDLHDYAILVTNFGTDCRPQTTPTPSSEPTPTAAPLLPSPTPEVSFDPNTCWDRVYSVDGNYQWPDGCKGAPITPGLMCTQALVSLTTSEIVQYLAWVGAGTPTIEACPATQDRNPTPTPVPIDSYSVCIDNACTTVPGTEADQCSTNVHCTSDNFDSATCWDQVYVQNNELLWPNGCKGAPADPTIFCTQALVPLTDSEISQYYAWVRAGKPANDLCPLSKFSQKIPNETP